MKQTHLKATAIVLLVVGLFSTNLLFAHHSFQMFDRTQLVLIKGSVTDWNFNNPHSWLHVEAPDSNGELQTWSFEGASPVHGVRQGVTGNTFRKGELVSIVMSPMKDGRNAGAMCFVVKENEEVTFPGDATCNAYMVAQQWETNSWVKEGAHLDSHSSAP
ncbi:MAG: hypothetical protein HOH14_10565 [Gammaproteobacteria bacterium]|jgi:hypothetical protein|nr:hypothetical protein [Gammaproteobacteria bacterium]MBT6043921.1 hypothetical protein [Gammaproteobacteria bacterium]